MNISDKKIAIIGLGYVGLPLAVEFGRKFNTIGFDINQSRINELNNGIDKTLEIEKEDLSTVLGNGLFKVSSDKTDLSQSNVFIVTVPTPTDKNNRPVLKPLLLASETIGAVLKKGDIVIYESTVYPGVTEDDCVPVLEKVSGLKFNIDFFNLTHPEFEEARRKKFQLLKGLKELVDLSLSKGSSINDPVIKSSIDLLNI
jgi:UDP-N-acetyl-D-galactosamine dehydrogenase